MVENPGKAPGADTFKPVNAPEPANVEENAAGYPVAIRMGRRKVRLSVIDRWRIDDEWWREQPVSRLYFEVMLAPGQRLTLYKDMISNSWHRQTY